MNIEQAKKIVEEEKDVTIENSIMASRLLITAVFIDNMAELGKELLKNELDFEYEACMGITITHDNLKAIAELIEEGMA
jgi:predicted thioesterase